MRRKRLSRVTSSLPVPFCLLRCPRGRKDAMNCRRGHEETPFPLSVFPFL